MWVLSSSLEYFEAHAIIDSEMKNYKLNTAAGADLSKSVGPSAEFMQMPIAFNYRSVF
jgi:general transcription factor 3C polypeptide 5 (transcription factor C subunit 1)